MKLTADTNLLVRIVVRDDAAQAQTALRILEEADLVAISTPCLCEFVWVLSSVYRLSGSDIAMAVRSITERANASIDAAPVAAGLHMLETRGDFADGVIAAAGSALGGETFVSFDHRAVVRLNAMGLTARHADLLA